MPMAAGKLRIVVLVHSLNASVQCATAKAISFQVRRSRYQSIAACYGQDSAIAVLISLGEANTIEARSPCMPAPMAGGRRGFQIHLLPRHAHHPSTARL